MILYGMQISRSECTSYDSSGDDRTRPKACEAGKKASAYTKAWLLGKMVSLDLDDKTGKDQYGRWVAVCYLDGKNFNKRLVDAGQVVVKDFKNNEFEPLSWWN
jgi:endonuclease YncB( thermonuclease family)